MGEAKNRRERYPDLYGHSQCPGAMIRTVLPEIEIKQVSEPGQWRTNAAGQKWFQKGPPQNLGHAVMKRHDRKEYNRIKKETRRASI